MPILRHWGIFAMKGWVGAVAATVMSMGVIPVACPASAQVAQMQLHAILHDMAPDDIALRRSACAMGRAPKLAADKQSAGIDSPSAGAWCVAVMTRTGRDGRLGYMRDPRSNQPTPAVAFDGGFVGGYLKHEAPPVGAPAMATLIPIADRCLDQRELNLKLCSSAGYILGLRAARGELIAAR